MILKRIVQLMSKKMYYVMENIYCKQYLISLLYFFIFFFKISDRMGPLRLTKTINQVEKNINNRNNIIQIIEKVRNNHLHFKRETLFIAISIIDKLYGKQPQQKLLQMYPCQVYAATAILLASKFNDIKPIKNQSIISCFQNCSFKLNDVIDAEEFVFVELDYTIPYETAYCQLQTKIKQECCGKSEKLVLKSLKFFNLIIKKWPETILDPLIGIQVYNLIFKNKGTRRIKQCYKIIAQKQNENKPKQSGQKK